MATRPKKDTLDTLRLTIQRIEQVADPEHDAESLAKLKRRVVSRVADLELLDTQKRGNTSPADTLEAADLALSPSAKTALLVEDGNDSIRSGEANDYKAD